MKTHINLIYIVFKPIIQEQEPPKQRAGSWGLCPGACVRSALTFLSPIFLCHKRVTRVLIITRVLAAAGIHTIKYKLDS